MLVRAAVLLLDWAPGVTRRVTASTAMGARTDEYCETILELRLVLAARRSDSRSLSSTGVEMSVRNSTALVAAFWKDSAMMVGWMPLLSIFSAAPSRLPATTTTEVVPSPASTSCACESSTSMRAAGCMTAMCLRMVAPSLVMTTSPLDVWIILSIPLGPSEVRTASLTALAADRLDLRTSSGLSAFLKAFCDGPPRASGAAAGAAADILGGCL